MIPEPSRSGTVKFREFETWYRVTGDLDSGRSPLLVAHGGPGATHDYTLQIAGIANGGRPVIHYDQLGNGSSTHLRDRGADFWTVELFLDEMDNLLTQLGVKNDYNLLGQSWGGMLGAEHAVLQPTGLRALVLSNSPASIPVWVAESQRLRAMLPQDTERALDRHEADGTIEDPEYLAATKAYYDEHVCRVVPNPPEVQRSWDALDADKTVYGTMNGPNEFLCIGTLKEWTIEDRVHEITAPTLLITGEFDEATPATQRAFYDNIPDVRWEVFASSSHLPFVEETERYLEVVGAFLDEHDD